MIIFGKPNLNVMKRLKNVSRLEITLFFLLAIAILDNINIRKDVKPLKVEVSTCRERSYELMNLAHELEKEAIYLKMVQGNISKSEDLINSFGGE